MKKVIIFFISILFLTVVISAQMKPIETGKILDTELIAINIDHVSVFFMKSKDNYLLFDSGVNSEKLAESMQKIGIKPEQVTNIFISHSDGDHVEGLTIFPNATIYASVEEMQLIEGKIVRREGRYNSLPKEIDVDKIITLEDNQELFIDDVHIRCILAPGHTPGSMLYLINDVYLYTGDAFSYVDGKIDIHPFTMDEELATKTIDILQDVINKAKIILFAHYGIAVQ